MTVLCVLPARLASRRLPRKPLLPLAGRPLIEWSWRAACRVEAFDEVWVATDAPEVASVVRELGGTAVLTDAEHASGTDRVAEAARRPEARGFDIVVNYQADEPFLDAGAIGRAVEAVRSGRAGVATLAAPIVDPEDWASPSVVKVVTARDGGALYFSRAPIPHPRDGSPELLAEAGSPYLRHLGLYAFGREALERWTALEPSRLERIERLEQLRALEAGLPIHVVVGPATGPGVDVPEDVERAERRLADESPTRRIRIDD
ncbi:MAG TPA: 3-deoxy-manno-octulosonate cytidylyltransferase [Gemmatimonadota bacterium]|nr:3-deoxy-manno-octulosonate cytidylyltransferase [Gemmatimonadota bacterium]